MKSVGIDLWKVVTSILYYENNDCHGDHMTDDWYDTYDAVGDWFETILIKCDLASTRRCRG
jgi:hypothetical protein